MVDSLIKGKILNKFEKICSISLYTLPLTSFGMNKNGVNNVNVNGVNNVNVNGVNNVVNNVVNDVDANTSEFESIIEQINNRFFSEKNYKFKFRNFISKGRYGKVVRVNIINKNTNRFYKEEYVLKITENSDADKNELLVLKNFKRNGIVNFYESYTIPKNNNTDKKLLIFALEYCKFGNLNDFKKSLKRNVFDETLVCYIAGKIVNTLESLHLCKYVHLDLKPDNILVDENLEFLLSDFSTCYKYSKEDFKNYPCIGTENYMAPEMFKRSKINNEEDFFKPDIYSLGGVLYKLSTGFFHYLKKSDISNLRVPVNIEDRIINGDVNLDNLKYLSDVFKDFLLKCLEKDVTKRPTIFDLKKHPFISNLYKILTDEVENFGGLKVGFSHLFTGHLKSYNDECEKYEIINDILTLKNTNIEVNNNENISTENKVNEEEVNEINNNEVIEEEVNEINEEEVNEINEEEVNEINNEKVNKEESVENVEKEEDKKYKKRMLKSIDDIFNDNYWKETNKKDIKLLNRKKNRK